MMRSRLIVPRELQRMQDGFACEIRLPWYRALPLFCIDMPRVLIDGEAVSEDAVRLVVNGRRYDAAKMAEADNDWWYVLDSAMLEIARPFPDGEHEITIEVRFAPPYIPEITLFCAASRTMAVA